MKSQHLHPPNPRTAPEFWTLHSSFTPASHSHVWCSEISSGHFTDHREKNAFRVFECVRVGAEKSEGAPRSNEEYAASSYTPEASSTQPGPFSCYYVVLVVNSSTREAVMFSVIWQWRGRHEEETGENLKYSMKWSVFIGSFMPDWRGHFAHRADPCIGYCNEHVLSKRLSGYWN